MSRPLAEKLVLLDSPLNEAYRRAITCAEWLKRDGDKVETMYCNARWCLTCNRIRTGKLMNAYTAPLAGLTDLYFVTLTAPNVEADQLRDEITRLQKVSRQIQDVMRKQGRKLEGIRKLEATYNVQANTYHPHFHYIVSGKEQAEQLRAEWLVRHPQASHKAQDIKPADEGSTKELFKYFTKLNAHQTPATALDVIFKAMEGKRVFQPLGGLRRYKVSEEVEEIQVHTYSELAPDENGSYEWQPAAADWVNIQTGECLTKYNPSPLARRYVRRIENLNLAPPS